jgi:hypothetical protein
MFTGGIGAIGVFIAIIVGLMWIAMPIFIYSIKKRSEEQVELLNAIKVLLEKDNSSANLES